MPGLPDVSDDARLPEGFRVGHWTDPDARTGCTVILPPPGTRGSVEVRGGGTGTRELEGLSPLANAEGPNAVLLTGGSAFGLAAADGVMRWLEERGQGRPPGPASFPWSPPRWCSIWSRGSPRDGRARMTATRRARRRAPTRASAARSGRAPGPRWASCSDASGRPAVAWATPPRDSLTARLIAVLVVANAFGDVIGERGELLGAPRGERGELVRTAELLAGMPELPDFRDLEPRATGNTTLACVCTDASVDKRTCAIVARMASAGIARAVDPAFTPLDGDVVFCLASGSGTSPAPGLAASWSVTVLGTVAATLTAAAVRDAVVTAR